MRIINSFRKFRLMAEGHPVFQSLSLAANCPIRRTGWLLDHITFRRAIPGHGPANRPSMAGAHLAAVHEVNPALRYLAVVHQQSRRPTRVRLDMSIPMKCAIQKHYWSRHSRARDKIENVVAVAGTTIE